MNPELLARFKELDRLGGFEEPVGFNFRAAIAEIQSHKSALEDILGCSLKTDGT
jgi:hypothetical protein